MSKSTLDEAIKLIVRVAENNFFATEEALNNYSGSCEGIGDTEEAIADAENNVPLDATPDSYDTFCEDDGEDGDTNG